MSRFSADLLARALQAVRAAQQAQPEAPAAAAQPGTVADQARPIVKAGCRRFEGCRLAVYLCPARVWSIGYGATYYVDGRAVGPQDPPISVPTAERLLDLQVDGTYLPAAQRLVPTADTPQRLAGVTDFAFNLGPTRLAGSTLRRKALAGDWAGAAEEALKWTRGGGRVLPGLVLRCQYRAALLR